MPAEYSFEKMCSAIVEMSKADVINKLLCFDGPLKLDFTREFLESLSADRLRHILLAAVLTAEKKQVS